MEKIKEEKIENTLRTMYGGYISEDILNMVIDSLKNNKEFIGKIEYYFQVDKYLNSFNEKNLLSLLTITHIFIEYLDKEIIKEFLFELDEDKLKNIKALDIPFKVFKEIINEQDIDISKKQKILGLLNYNDDFTFSKFKDDKEIAKKLILEIIPNNKLKNITLNSISNFLEEIVDTIRNDNNEDRKLQNIEKIKVLKYVNTSNLFSDFEKNDSIEYLLRILPNKTIKKINITQIPFELFKNFFEKNDEELKEILDSLDYKNIFIDNKYKVENIEDVKFLLKIIPENKLKNNSINSNFIKNFLKKIITSETGNLLDRIGSFYYNDIDIKNIINTLLDKGQNENKDILIKFLLHLDSQNLGKFLVNINDKEIVKEIILNSNKVISLNNININLFTQLLLESKDNNLKDKIKKFDYSIDYSIDKLFINKSLSNSEKEKIAENFLSNINEEIIKTFSSKNIAVLLTNKVFKNLLSDNLKLELKNILVLRIFEDGFEDYDIITNKNILNYNEFQKIFLKFVEKKEINKIDLSKFDFGKKNNKKIVNEILKKNFDELPKFNIRLFSDNEIFVLIKNDKIKSVNVSTEENHYLSFLRDSIKFDIVQKIIKTDKLFLEDKKFNMEILKELSKTLTETEINSFVKFYCNSKKIKYNINISNNLMKSLKDFNIKSDLAKLIYNNYKEKNNSLEVNGNKNGYLLNRQKNLYLLLKALRKKFTKRLEKLEFSDELKDKREKLNKNIILLTEYIKNLKNHKDENGMISFCKHEDEIEIFNFVTKQYCNEVLRRILIDYHRRIKPFVDEYFKKEDDISPEEISERIEEALGILFYYKSSNYSKLEAQKQLKKYFNIIGNKYKEIFGKEFISGEYITLSSICCASNLEELNLAIYSKINDRITNDYLSEMVYKNRVNPGINDFILFRGFNIEDKRDKIINNHMKYSIAKSGRTNYTCWDMTDTCWDMTDGKGFINTDCSSENTESAVGSLTSFSTNARVSMGITRPPFLSGDVFYGKSFTCVYCIPENLRKEFFNTVEILSESSGFDIPIEYRIFTIAFDKWKPYYDDDMNNNPNFNAKIVDVKFCEKMDFITFKIKENYKNYKKDQIITQDQLKNIIMSLNRLELSDFLNKYLNIERVFDKFKVLHEEEKRIYKKNRKNTLKTIEIEKKIENIKVKIKSNKKILLENNYNNIKNDIELAINEEKSLVKNRVKHYEDKLKKNSKINFSINDSISVEEITKKIEKSGKKSDKNISKLINNKITLSELLSCKNFRESTLPKITIYNEKNDIEKIYKNGFGGIIKYNNSFSDKIVINFKKNSFLVEQLKKLNYNGEYNDLINIFTKNGIIIRGINNIDKDELKNFFITIKINPIMAYLKLSENKNIKIKYKNFIKEKDIDEEANNKIKDIFAIITDKRKALDCVEYCRNNLNNIVECNNKYKNFADILIKESMNIIKTEKISKNLNDKLVNTNSNKNKIEILKYSTELLYMIDNFLKNKQKDLNNFSEDERNNIKKQEEILENLCNGNKSLDSFVNFINSEKLSDLKNINKSLDINIEEENLSKSL